MPFQSNLCDDYWAPFASSVTTATVSAILCVITVPGNLLICWAVICDPNRNLKTSFNYLVLNIAVADLIVGAVTEPVFVGYHADEALKHNVLGVRWIVYMSYFMTTTASVLSIAALAANRYRAVKTHYVTTNHSTRTSIKISVLVWLFSFGLPLLYIGIGFYLLAFIFANTAVVATIGVLLFVYVGVYRKVRQHRKATEHLLQFRTQEKRARLEERATASLLLIIGSFVIFVGPSCVMVYVINLCHNCSCVLIQWFRDLQYLFVLANSASNQFLYAWRVRTFRRAFYKVTIVRWFSNLLSRDRVDLEKSVTTNTENQQPKLVDSIGACKYISGNQNGVAVIVHTSRNEIGSTA